MQKYFPPMSVLCEALGTTPEELSDEGTVNVPVMLLRHLIKCALGDLEIDLAVYKEQNRDLSRAKTPLSSQELEKHYKVTGYFEGRLLPVRFDQEYYLQRYPDVQVALRAKRLDKPLSHYYSQGIAEMRVPRQDLEGPISEWCQLLTAVRARLNNV